MVLMVASWSSKPQVSVRTRLFAPKKDIMIKRNRIKNSAFSLCGKSNYRWSLCDVNKYSITNKRFMSWVQQCTSVSGNNQTFYSSASKDFN